MKEEGSQRLGIFFCDIPALASDWNYVDVRAMKGNSSGVKAFFAQDFVFGEAGVPKEAISFLEEG